MKLLAIDFETTGLLKAPTAKHHLQPRAIEFAGCMIDGRGTIIQEDSFLINPGEEISEEITRITSITNEMLKDALPFKDCWLRLAGFLELADAVVAHNMPFDAYILRRELDAARIEWEWPCPLLCTVELYEPLWGFRPRLIQLYEATTGKQYEQTHRALDDVRALTEILIHDKIAQWLPTIAMQDRAYIPPELRPRGSDGRTLRGAGHA